MRGIERVRLHADLTMLGRLALALNRVRAAPARGVGLRAVGTAQETWKAMMRDQVAPGLRALGLKGSGQNFTLPSEKHWALLGFQKSDFSDRTQIRFTVNMTVVGREAWDRGRESWPNVSARPGANWQLAPMMQAAFDGYWHTRVGFLMPGGRDRWWGIAADEDTQDVAEAVVAEIGEFALPAMRARMTYGRSANPSF